MIPLPAPLPDWAKSSITTLIGAVIGFISGFLADALKTRRTERRKSERMRRAIYVEITQHYHAIKSLLDGLKEVEPLLTSLDELRAAIGEAKERVKEAEDKARGTGLLELKRDLQEREEKFEERSTRLAETLNAVRPILARLFALISTESYKYAKSNPDVFYEHTEAWIIDACYLDLQFMLTGIESSDLKATLKSARSFLSSVDKAVDSGRLDKKLLAKVAAPLHAEMGGHAAQSGAAVAAPLSNADKR
jgi:hypothetical protein